MKRYDSTVDYGIREDPDSVEYENTRQFCAAVLVFLYFDLSDRKNVQLPVVSRIL